MKLLPISLSTDAIARFHGLVDRRGEDDCWPWLGIKDQEGRGRLKERAAAYIAARVAWQVAHGRQPLGMVCHRCDNPGCCNPSHLWLGTNKDNQTDSALKGRARGQSLTHCASGHPYNAENTYWRPKSVASRDCRRCAVERSRRYRQKQELRR